MVPGWGHNCGGDHVGVRINGHSRGRVRYDGDNNDTCGRTFSRGTVDNRMTVSAVHVWDGATVIGDDERGHLFLSRVTATGCFTKPSVVGDLTTLVVRPSLSRRGYVVQRLDLLGLLFRPRDMVRGSQSRTTGMLSP